MTDYWELDNALTELEIDLPVYELAYDVAKILADVGIEAPRVSCHGPKSAVFTWERGKNNFYLTISKNHISLLASDPERINMRREFALA
jgi:hypothetical protein